MSPLAVFVLELPLFAQDSAGLQPGIFLALRCHPACPDEGRERSSALQLFLGLRCHPERGRFLADEGPAVILVWVGVFAFLAAKCSSALAHIHPTVIPPAQTKEGSKVPRASAFLLLFSWSFRGAEHRGAAQVDG
jgi:hypothetical protein